MRRTLWLVNSPMSPRGLKVTTTFHDFAIVTFAVEPERLAPLLPRGFDAEVFTLDDGSRRSFVSAVSLRNVAFGVKTLPRPWFTFAQINYRAYVRYRGERAVWFFGTMLGSPLAVAIPRYIWRLPWHAAEITLVARWRGELCETYALDARSHWGTATLRCTGRPNRWAAWTVSPASMKRVSSLPTRCAATPGAATVASPRTPSGTTASR